MGKRIVKFIINMISCSSENKYACLSGKYEQ